MFQVETVQSFYLSSPDELTRYQFIVSDRQPSLVLVTRTVDATPDTYILLKEEARELWKRLRDKGYERE